MKRYLLRSPAALITVVVGAVLMVGLVVVVALGAGLLPATPPPGKAAAGSAPPPASACQGVVDRFLVAITDDTAKGQEAWASKVDDLVVPTMRGPVRNIDRARLPDTPSGPAVVASAVVASCDATATFADGTVWEVQASKLGRTWQVSFWDET